MARTKKMTEEMNQNLNAGEEMLEGTSPELETDSDASFSDNLGEETPVLLSDAEALQDTEGNELLPDEEVTPDAEQTDDNFDEDISPEQETANADAEQSENENAAASEQSDAEGVKPEVTEGADSEPLTDTEETTPVPEPTGADMEKKVAAPKKSATRKKTSAAEKAETPTPPKRAAKAKSAVPSVLTIDSRSEAETPEAREDIIWHEIHNAYRTRKILTGTLGGLEQTETGKTIAIAYYKDFRIVIPMSEMMINLSQDPSKNYGEMMLRQSKILGTMLGAEIDFMVKGIDSKTRSVVASRKDAMFKKRQLFYMGTDANGMYRIYEDRIVQARVIAVADKVIRVEAFGVECSIMARDLSWDWMGDAHERFSVGDQVLIRILNVKRENLESITIRADVKSVSGNTGRENLKKCRVQGKYAGKVTDIHKGTVFVRLSIGVNAIAHSCYDNRMPGKKDDVSFAVTHLDEERGVAVGIITRIIKQNL